VSVRRGTPDDVEGAVAVLAALPDFFTPDTHASLRAGWAEHASWVAVDGAAVVGLALVERRYPASAEITYAAVRPERRASGIGTAVVVALLDDLAADGVAVVEVKTLDESAGYEPYVATRAFWERLGFVQVDCIDLLPGWQPGNPAAIYAAALRPTR
jgi:ribosomal protein S18 acetylase RimI-like enzyme